jgi:transposase
LAQIARVNPRGPIRVVTDNLSSHTSVKVCGWLAGHRRIQQVFIPKAACWLNLAEGWWRLLRKAAFAGQSFVDTDEIAYGVQTATAQLNAHAKPWIWGRPPPPTRKLRRKFTYCL